MSDTAVLVFPESGGAAEFISQAYDMIKRSETVLVYNTRCYTTQWDEVISGTNVTPHRQTWWQTDNITMKHRQKNKLHALQVLLCRKVSKSICTQCTNTAVTMRRSPTQITIFFKFLMTSNILMLLFRSAARKEFQKRGPAAEKLLSPRRLRVPCTEHVKQSADRNDRLSSLNEAGRMLIKD